MPGRGWRVVVLRRQPRLTRMTSMSKIIAFPRNRAYARQHSLYTRARINGKAPSTGRSPSSVRRDAPRTDTVEPIWKSSTHGILMSAVVPTCNRPDLLERCLAALVNQQFDPTRFEILIVDDGPSDATRAVVEKWMAQTATVGPRIFYIPSDGPHGPAAARNRGWHAARGTVIAFTDDDTIPYPDWLAKGLAAFDGAAQVVRGRIVMPLAGLPTDYERDAKGLETAEFVTANCFCLKRVLEDLGGFDERFRYAWREDSDLHFRLLQADVDIRQAPEAVVEHPIRPARWGVSISQQKKIQFDALLYKKHPRLYRERIRASARWDYYAIVACLFAMVAALVWRQPATGLVAGACWFLLTARFCLQRLHGTIMSASHILEMIVTSAVIPPLAVFWRLVGIARFRVGFL
jgi:glycosyltransferase involved in cell wall biosynthesis